MILARVLGTVVSTRKDSGLMSLKLLLTREVDAQFQPVGNFVVAADAVGAGEGEVVLLAQGSSARMTEVSREKPVDAVICGIVDAVEMGGKDLYLKRASGVGASAGTAEERTGSASARGSGARTAGNPADRTR